MGVKVTVEVSGCMPVVKIGAVRESSGGCELGDHEWRQLGKIPHHRIHQNPLPQVGDRDFQADWIMAPGGPVRIRSFVFSWVVGLRLHEFVVWIGQVPGW